MAVHVAEIAQFYISTHMAVYYSVQSLTSAIVFITFLQYLAHYDLSGAALNATPIYPRVHLT